eukprot:m.497095 g.497095  ORF g.497095 m.497095 type:complete len:301 (+) comp21812_c0_seq8:270-1172(+)
MMARCGNAGRSCGYIVLVVLICISETIAPDPDQVYPATKHHESIHGGANRLLPLNDEVKLRSPRDHVHPRMLADSHDTDRAADMYADIAIGKAIGINAGFRRESLPNGDFAAPVERVAVRPVATTTPTNDTFVVLAGLLVLLGLLHAQSAVGKRTVRHISIAESVDSIPPARKRSKLLADVEENVFFDDTVPTSPKRIPPLTQHEQSDFRKFSWLYLPVFLSASFSDWLIGPYVYAVYESVSIVGTTCSLLQRVIMMYENDIYSRGFIAQNSDISKAPFQTYIMGQPHRIQPVTFVVRQA